MSGDSGWRSATRLIVGALLTGYDGLTQRVSNWEQKVPLSAADAGSYNQKADKPQLAEAEPLPEPRLQHMLVGLFFKAEEQVETYLNTAERASRLVGKLADLTIGPLYRSRWLSPLRHNVDRFADRGQKVVNEWIRLGQAESHRSRELVKTALNEQVDNAIDQLAANEKVQELVQSQSAGLVDELIEETRERTVSADDFLEAIVRSLFRRQPRWKLPEPPQEMIAQAEKQHRQLYGRSLHK
ncbi:MAG: hypothetical protein QME21_05675 [Anaerolineales bacterium]|nr:hypothetical protein [Anaerolineales bacterium]